MVLDVSLYFWEFNETTSNKLHLRPSREAKNFEKHPILHSYFDKKRNEQFSGRNVTCDVQLSSRHSHQCNIHSNTSACKNRTWKEILLSARRLYRLFTLFTLSASFVLWFSCICITARFIDKSNAKVPKQTTERIGRYSQSKYTSYLCRIETGGGSKTDSIHFYMPH